MSHIFLLEGRLDKWNWRTLLFSFSLPSRPKPPGHLICDGSGVVKTWQDDSAPAPVSDGNVARGHLHNNSVLWVAQNVKVSPQDSVKILRPHGRALN